MNRLMAMVFGWILLAVVVAAIVSIVALAFKADTKGVLKPRPSPTPATVPN